MFLKKVLHEREEKMQEKMKMTWKKDQNLAQVQPQCSVDFSIKMIFWAKINTTLLLYLYQIFIFLLGRLHFFLHFFFSFMENLLKKHPIHPASPVGIERKKRPDVETRMEDRSMT